MKKNKEQAELTEKEGYERAEAMTKAAFEDGLTAYVSRAGDLFEEEFSGPFSRTNAQGLVNRLELKAKNIQQGIANLEFLSPDDADRVVRALQLPFDVHFSEYTFVGKGGSCRQDRAFDVEEQLSVCDETFERSLVIEALANYCISAGVIARRIGAIPELRLFMRCLELMEPNCRTRGYENEEGGLPEKEATNVCNWLCLATQRLWSLLKVSFRDRRWNEEDKKAAEQVPTVVPKKGSKKGKILISDDMPDTSGIAMGPWAKKVLYSFNGTTRTLVFRGKKRVEPGERIACPLGADEPWKHIVGMVTSTDSEGWYEVPAADISCYRQQFLRSDKDKKGNPTKNSVALHLFYDHIQNRNAPGEHAATQIRLVRRKIRNFETKPRKRQKATAVKGVKTPKIKV